MIGEYDAPLINKMISEKNKTIEVKTCDNWSKFNIDSIT